MIIQSGHNFAHVMTAELSWHVQNFGLMWPLLFHVKVHIQVRIFRYFHRELDYMPIKSLWNGSLGYQISMSTHKDIPHVPSKPTQIIYNANYSNKVVSLCIILKKKCIYQEMHIHGFKWQTVIIVHMTTILTHLPQWHIYASQNWVTTGLDNDLLPLWHHAIISTNAELPSITPQATNFGEKITKIVQSSLMKFHSK